MTQATTPTATPAPINNLSNNGRPKILGFVCEWSVGRTDLIHEDGTVKGMDHVKTIRVPCSGFVKTEWVTLAFESGAQGVFVLGCPLGDCHFNEGNFILDDKGRVAELYLGATEKDDFTGSLETFTKYVEEMPPLVVVKKGKK
jgi:coenzyme F420-reducing hydrogenase delta subunit